MAKKRGNGEGSIYKEGIKWRAQVTTGHDPQTGRQRFKKSPRYDTRADAAKWLKETKGAMDKGISVDKRVPTVGEWLETWLTEYKAKQVRPATMVIYEKIVKLHLIEIAAIKLDKLTTHQVQQLLNSRSDRPRTSEQMKKVLSQALDLAVKQGLILRNVAKLSESARYEKPQIKPMTREEVRRFLEAAADHRLYPALCLMAQTGMRRGEVLGLRWQDINLGKHYLDVNQSLITLPGGESVFNPPKTAKGRRRIPLSPQLVKILKAWKAKSTEERLRWATIWERPDLVFVNEIGGVIDSHNFSRTFRKVRDLAGLSKEYHPHSMRHTMATLLLEEGQHPKVVQEILGHANISMTLDTYSTVIPGLKEAAIESLGDLFGPAKQPEKEGKKSQ